jgi:hypothetical protein
MPGGSFRIKEIDMFGKEDLQFLVEQDFQVPVLSVSLNTHPAEESADTYKLRLRSLLEGKDPEEDVRAVTRYFDSQYDWKNYRSAVVFSAQGQDFFQAYPLQVRMWDQVRMGSSPDLIPLLNAYNAHSGNGVALINQQEGRFLAFEMGELLEEQHHQGEDVQRQKHGGGSQTTGTWRGDQGAGDTSDMTVERNLRSAADTADAFFKRHEVRRVFLGGTDENISSFRKFLPKRWQSLIVDEFQLDLESPAAAVQEAVQELLREEEQRRKGNLVDKAITEAAKGRHGLLRVDEILSAVPEGRVQTLIVDREFHQEGYRCSGCEYLTVQELNACPFCGEEFEAIPDLSGMLVKDVLASGGSVEVLEDNQALQERDKIGALLRY